ncbi:hypothetical protein KP77_25240 [Jeotgalibacillus alimentarius]|uniref:DUF1064 domain-containing protein n=1 Tax=Jeotgalibacillus alimentarius TaxID=135826 RepID=A0A0C2R9F1_9BACL|nr:DUF1064 domain-containing protein [Jeotgalibacillus alimentarius]KIL46955.1 hypothetical protein KP77_25240 [Jeotgalibacillus alimentarius]
MKKSKYGNKKVTVDGIKFDSILEAQYYKQLLWAKEHEDILMFRIQPRYMLQEAFEKNGVKHQRIDYIADFEVHREDGTIDVIDIKTTGTKTDVFRIKQKLFEKKYPHKLILLTYDQRAGGWIELEKLEQLMRMQKKGPKKG